jgi:hypothetical protein
VAWRRRRLKSVRVLLYFRALKCQNCQQIVVKELARGFHPVAGNQATTRKSRFFKLFRSYLTLFDFLASRDKSSVTWTSPSSETTPAT